MPRSKLPPDHKKRLMKSVENVDMPARKKSKKRPLFPSRKLKGIAGKANRKANSNEQGMGSG